MSKVCFIITFIALWIVSGFASIVFAHAYDVRGKEYDENYLNGEMKYIILFSLGGCITVILTIIAFISVWFDEHKPKSRPFTKFIYWLGNIGIKKDGDDK
mgnify:CR=1 FL=1|nr:hypothetical protein [uncultured Lachnoclostridium sp.]